MKAAHSQAPMRTSTVSSQTVAMGGRPSVTTSRTATSAIAVSTRCLSTAGRPERLVAQLVTGLAEPPFTSFEGAERRRELPQVEIRPQRVAHEDLRVRQVPQQEIADSMIAAGTDEQIGIRQVAERQLAGETLLADVVDPQRAASHGRRQLACRLQDVP